MDIFNTLLAREGDKRNRLFEAWYNTVQDKLAYRKIDEAFIQRKATSFRKLRITYIMNHVRVCGGSKIIFEHTNHLVRRGHDVSILCYYPRPDWIEVNARYIQVPSQMNLYDCMPETDIIICTVYDQIIEPYLLKKAPVLLFEQGDSYIFDFEKYPLDLQEVFKKRWSVPIPVIAVSSGLSDQLKRNFNRTPQILHNALNSNIFYPREKKLSGRYKPRILFVGQEQVKFKGISDVRTALEIVRKSGRDFEEVWVSQTPPDTSFKGELYVNPDQELLGDIYRSCDIYVSGSYYESFPLPPLEAMACGCAVVSTDNTGIKEYGEDGYNCLLGKVGDPQSLADHIISLLDNPEKMNSLMENGYKTAARFSWDKIIVQLEKYISTTIDIWNENNKARDLSLRIERLPKGLSQTEASDLIREIQMSMKEDWCLWLVEGETLEEGHVKQIERILKEPFGEKFSLQVIYQHDIPEHPVARLENRLLKRGDLSFGELGMGEVLPIRITGGSEAYFLPKWLADVREMYLERKYLNIVDYSKSKITNLSINEQGILTKWVILSLLELELYNEAAQIIRDTLDIYITYSDLLYLTARLTIILGQNDISNHSLALAKNIGDAVYYHEYFYDMRNLCNMYLTE